MVFSAALYALALSLPLLSVNGASSLYTFRISNFLIVPTALRTRRALCPDGVNTAINLACCSLFPVVQDIQENFLTNECGDSVCFSLYSTYQTRG